MNSVGYAGRALPHPLLPFQLVTADDDLTLSNQNVASAARLRFPDAGRGGGQQPSDETRCGGSCRLVASRRHDDAEADAEDDDGAGRRQLGAAKIPAPLVHPGGGHQGRGPKERAGEHDDGACEVFHDTALGLEAFPH